MRKNGYSSAFREYESSLGRAAALRKIETKHYRDPPPPAERGAVEALRGGATVLMTAALERYLREAIEEYVGAVAVAAGDTRHPKLPQKLVDCNDLNFVDWLIRSNRIKKAQKLSEIRRVYKEVSDGKFVPESFSRLRANPGPQTVKELFRGLGIEDAFGEIEGRFGRHYKAPFSAGFVAAKLNSIVERRNDVAHEGAALNISRSDICEWLRFLSCFAKATDNALREHTRSILSALR